VKLTTKCYHSQAHRYHDYYKCQLVEGGDTPDDDSD